MNISNPSIIQNWNRQARNSESVADVENSLNLEKINLAKLEEEY